MRKRKTVSRDVIVERANAMIKHLAESGTHVDQVKREAILAIVDSILLGGDAYRGFRSMNPPAEFKTWDDFYAYGDKGSVPYTWDNTRRLYY